MGRRKGKGHRHHLIEEEEKARIANEIATTGCDRGGGNKNRKGKNNSKAKKGREEEEKKEDPKDVTPKMTNGKGVEKRRMEILSCMQFVLHAGQFGVFYLNNFTLAEQWQNSERLNLFIFRCEREFRCNKNNVYFLFF